MACGYHYYPVTQTIRSIFTVSIEVLSTLLPAVTRVILLPKQYGQSLRLLLMPSLLLSAVTRVTLLPRQHAQNVLFMLTPLRYLQLSLLPAHSQQDIFF